LRGPDAVAEIVPNMFDDLFSPSRPEGEERVGRDFPNTKNFAL